MHLRIAGVDRRAVTLVEVGLAFAILVIAIVPMIVLFTSGREQTQMSEHQIYGELSGFRSQEDIATRNYGWIYNNPGESDLTFDQLQGIDAGDSVPDHWDDKMPEFKANAWQGVDPFKAKMFTERVGDEKGQGIMAIKVSVTWGDLAAHQSVKAENYNMLRLRAKRDFCLRNVDAPL